MIEINHALQTVTLPREQFEHLTDFLLHDSWRCQYPDRYPDCCCGLDNLCDLLGIDRVPRPGGET